MGVSSVDSEESLEEGVIAGMRYVHVFDIILCPKRKVRTQQTMTLGSNYWHQSLLAEFVWGHFWEDTMHGALMLLNCSSSSLLCTL